MTHIALEGGCFVLSANQFCRRKDYPPPPEYIFSGTEEDLTPESVVCAGGSVIISPSGTVLAGPNYEGEALISADLGLLCCTGNCYFETCSVVKEKELACRCSFSNCIFSSYYLKNWLIQKKKNLDLEALNFSYTWIY